MCIYINGGFGRCILKGMKMQMRENFDKMFDDNVRVSKMTAYGVFFKKGHP